jgi:hypothetical protein
MEIMKRFFMLVLLLNLVVVGLYAQKKSKNSIQSFLTIETGASFPLDQTQNFSIPFNIEFQRIKKKWSFGAAIGLDFDKYSWGDCNRREEVGSTKPFSLLNGSFLIPPFQYYCINDKYFTIKPTVFGSYTFFQKKKVNVFAKMGVAVPILKIFHYAGEFYEYEAKMDSLGLYTFKVTNPGPIHLVKNRHLWNIDHLEMIGSLGLNYAFNKRINLRFTLQSVTKLFLFDSYDSDEKRVLFSGLCGLSFKI